MRFSGYDTYTPRVLAFAFAGFIAAVAGLLIGLLHRLRFPRTSRLLDRRERARRDADRRRRHARRAGSGRAALRDRAGSVRRDRQSRIADRHWGRARHLSLSRGRDRFSAPRDCVCSGAAGAPGRPAVTAEPRDERPRISRSPGAPIRLEMASFETGGRRDALEQACGTDSKEETKNETHIDHPGADPVLAGRSHGRRYNQAWGREYRQRPLRGQRSLRERWRDFRGRVAKRAGGALGRKYELVIQNHDGKPASAIEAAKKLVEEKGVSFFTGLNPSGTSLAIESKLPGNQRAFHRCDRGLQRSDWKGLHPELFPRRPHGRHAGQYLHRAREGKRHQVLGSHDG